MSDLTGILLVLALCYVGGGLVELAKAVYGLTRDGLRIRDEVVHKITHEIKEEKEPWQGGDGEGTPP